MAGDRISLFANGQETVLCDFTDTVREGADFEPQSEFQIVKYVRGLAAVVFDRANESTTLAFTVTRDWPDDVKAFDAWINCRSVTPRKGDLTWRARNGSSSFSRFLIGCGVRVKPIERIGAMTRIQYTCIGGKITSSPPSQ